MAFGSATRAMLATWQEQFEQDYTTPAKLLNFERCLCLIMAVVSVFWLIEYRASRLSSIHTKDNVLTAPVNITLFQNNPRESIAEQKPEPEEIDTQSRPVEAQIPPTSELTAPQISSPKTEVMPAIEPSRPITTIDLLKEAIDLNTQSNSLPSTNSTMFNSKLEEQLDALRQKRKQKTEKPTQLEKHASTVDSHGDLRARAGNGCVFRRDDSGGVLDGTWYAEGCDKEETISLKLPKTLKVPKPSFQIK